MGVTKDRLPRFAWFFFIFILHIENENATNLGLNEVTKQNSNFETVGTVVQPNTPVT